MKVWIDILTPKHALVFEPLYRDVIKDGHEMLLRRLIGVWLFWFVFFLSIGV